MPDKLTPEIPPLALTPPSSLDSDASVFPWIYVLVYRVTDGVLAFRHCYVEARDEASAYAEGHSSREYLLPRGAARLTDYVIPLSWSDYPDEVLE